MKGKIEPGEEKFEKFYSSTVKKKIVEYAYRTMEGKLFATVAPTLKACRARRDNWLAKQ